MRAVLRMRARRPLRGEVCSSSPGPSFSRSPCGGENEIGADRLLSTLPCRLERPDRLESGQWEWPLSGAARLTAHDP